MMITKSVVRSVVVVASLLASEVSQASIVTYSTQASFLAAVSAPGVDTFDDLPIGSSLVGPLSRTAGAYMYRGTVVPPDTFFVAGSAPGDSWLSTNIGSESMVFSGFSDGLRAVGGLFFGTDINGDFTAGQDILVVATDGIDTETQTLLNTTTSTFFGFVSTNPFVSLTVSGVPSNVVFFPTVNDLSLASPSATGVPEPTSMALVVLALALGFGLQRRI